MAIALSGCSASASPDVASTTETPAAGSAPMALPSVTYTRGLPSNATPNTAFEAYAAWADPGRMYVVTFGSSTCPKVPTGMTVATGNRLTVTTKPTSDGPCTMDISPTTSVVDVPAGVDDRKPVEVTIDGAVSVISPR